MAANSTQLEEFIQYTQAAVFQDYLSTSSATLIAYACIIGIGDESRYMWPNALRPASILYITMRYGWFLTVFIGTFSSPTASNCPAVIDAGNTFALLVLCAGYTFQIIRTRALCDRNNKLTIALVLLCAPSILAQLYASVTSTCESFANVPSLIVQAVFELLFESTILVATVWRTWHLVVSQRTWQERRDSLSTALLKNGVLYFGIIVFFDIANILFNIPALYDNFQGNLFLNFLVNVSNPVRWVVLTNFIIDLRARTERPPGSTSLDMSPGTRSNMHFRDTLRFARRTLSEDFGEPGNAGTGTGTGTSTSAVGAFGESPAGRSSFDGVSREGDGLGKDEPVELDVRSQAVPANASPQPEEQAIIEV